MKNLASRSLRRKGFTLLELLFVMAIIVGLAAFMANAVGPAKKRIARSNTEGLIKMLETGLEQYHATYGSYPINPDPDKGSQILYHALFGDYDCNGKADWLEDTSGKSDDVKTFVKDLQPPRVNSNGESEGGKGYVKKIDDHWQVVDAWGEPIYYVNYKPKTNSEVPNGGGKHNAKYDLWSLGNDPDPSDENISMWIKNW